MDIKTIKAPPKVGINLPEQSLAWMSYAEWKAHDEFLKQKELEWFEMNGLGWLLEFTARPKK